MIAVKEIFQGKFGFAKNVLVEEFLQGEEMSFYNHDGKIFKNFDTAQDHKEFWRATKVKIQVAWVHSPSD